MPGFAPFSSSTRDLAGLLFVAGMRQSEVSALRGADIADAGRRATGVLVTLSATARRGARRRGTVPASGRTARLPRPGRAFGCGGRPGCPQPATVVSGARRKKPDGRPNHDGRHAERAVGGDPGPARHSLRHIAGVVFGRLALRRGRARAPDADRAPPRPRPPPARTPAGPMPGRSARGRDPRRVPRRAPRPGPGAGERLDGGGRGVLPDQPRRRAEPGRRTDGPGPRGLPADGRRSRPGAGAAVRGGGPRRRHRGGFSSWPGCSEAKRGERAPAGAAVADAADGDGVLVTSRLQLPGGSAGITKGLPPSSKRCLPTADRPSQWHFG